MLVNQAEQALTIEKDAIKRELLKDAIAELRNASQSKLIKCSP
jgi:hypothetical protein